MEAVACDLVELLAGHGLPDAEGAVLSSGEDELAVEAELAAVDTALVACEDCHHVSVEAVPEPDGGVGVASEEDVALGVPLEELGRWGRKGLTMGSGSPSGWLRSLLWKSFSRLKTCTSPWRRATARSLPSKEKQSRETVWPQNFWIWIWPS